MEDIIRDFSISLDATIEDLGIGKIQVGNQTFVEYYKGLLSASRDVAETLRAEGRGYYTNCCRWNVNVMKLPYIGPNESNCSGAFTCCFGLRNVDLNNWEGITNISYMFEYCTSL